MNSEFLTSNPHYIITHHFFDLNRDLSGNSSIDIPSLNNGEYEQFMKDVNNAVRMGELRISIYTDPSGINFALDTNGNPINNRIVTATSYVYAYVDFSGNFIEGVLTCVFDDESTFSNYDINNSAYWYFINGVSDPNNLQQYT